MAMVGQVINSAILVVYVSRCVLRGGLMFRSFRSVVRASIASLILVFSFRVDAGAAADIE